MEIFYAGLILDFPYNIQRVEQLSLFQEINEHAVLRFKAVIPEHHSESLQRMSVDDKVSLFKAHPIDEKRKNQFLKESSNKRLCSMCRV
ncbi:hypothetical protein ACFQY3_11955 [Paenibacillus farraposensis]|uniref:hypothetical protein n=1 Tax=Paenibacillus farraposensis TaxID=2807095 RepID=UPI00360C79F4